MGPGTEMKTPTLGTTLGAISRYAGILSAFGMAQADVVHEAQEPCGRLYATGTDCWLISGGGGWLC